MLELRDIASGYGETQVLHGMNLTLPKGQVHALLGRNGVGKTTTLKTIMGLVAPTRGTIYFDGRNIAGTAPHLLAKAGLAYVPETRDIFKSLSVRENLGLAARLAGPNTRWPLARVLDFFPFLKQRLDNGGQQLSGGEQQMLAIARALMADPKLMLLDEPTEGLAPLIIRQLFEKLQDLKQAGLTILLVEQNLGFALDLADEASVMSRGACVWHGATAKLRGPEAMAHVLGLSREDKNAISP